MSKVKVCFTIEWRGETVEFKKVEEIRDQELVETLKERFSAFDKELKERVISHYLKDLLGEEKVNNIKIYFDI